MNQQNFLKINCNLFAPGYVYYNMKNKKIGLYVMLGMLPLGIPVILAIESYKFIKRKLKRNVLQS